MEAVVPYYRKAIFLTPFLLIAFWAGAQKDGDPSKASSYLFDQNYDAALEEYLGLLEEDPDNSVYNYNVGVCYVNSNFEKLKAIPYLEKVLYYDKFQYNAYYMMARAYHFDHQFDEAIAMYTKFKLNAPGSNTKDLDIDRQIEYCENAKALTKYPVPVKFENLGSNINSEYPDYFPFIPTSENFLIFNSRRDDGSRMTRSGLFASNVYISTVQDGEYAPARPVSQEVNTDNGNEAVVGLSYTGEKVLFQLDNKEKDASQLYLSEKVGDVIKPPVLLDETINSTNNEISACISKDGRSIYFASKRKGGFGGKDIYITRMLPTGEWGEPENLGPGVNTEYDEDFPNLAPDEKSLYFSSKGHFGIGGYDIFVAKFDADTRKFLAPRNLGYPINDIGDDLNFRVSKSGRYGYIAAVREEGFGDFDIYRVTFQEVLTELTVVKGIVSSKAGKPEGTTITVTSTDPTNDYLGIFVPNANTNRYIVVLPPGEYNMMVETPGYGTVERVFRILGKGSFEAERTEDIQLEKN